MEKSTMLLLLGAMSLSCALGPSARKPYKQQRRVKLLKKHIEQLKSNEQQLTQIQVFLGARLKLEGNKTDVQKHITEAHGIKVYQTERKDKLVFEQHIPGRIISAYEEAKFIIFVKAIKILVCFEPDEERFFVFSPGANGVYHLEIDSDKLNYGAHEYDCIEGCSDNYLLIAADIVKDLQETTRYITGWPFE